MARKLRDIKLAKNRHSNRTREAEIETVSMTTKTKVEMKDCKVHGVESSNTSESSILQNGGILHAEHRNHIIDKDTCDIDMTRADHGDNQLFPRYLHWLVFIGTLIFRVWYVTVPRNWWVLHPDEIYQTIEVAHSETYGYGFRPYEYSPPPAEGVDNSTMCSAHAQEVKLGMYSLRSFLLVKVIALIMVTADFCGTKLSPFMVTKIFHAVVTSTLPLAVFKFTKALSGSRDTGTLAAIFVSCSVSLNVLGTHTLINSFLSPLLFYSLVMFVQIVLYKRSLNYNNPKETRANSKSTDSKNDILPTQMRGRYTGFVSSAKKTFDTIMSNISKLGINASIVLKWNTSAAKRFSINCRNTMQNGTPIGHSKANGTVHAQFNDTANEGFKTSNGFNEINNGYANEHLKSTNGIQEITNKKENGHYKQRACDHETFKHTHKHLKTNKRLTDRTAKDHVKPQNWHTLSYLYSVLNNGSPWKTINASEYFSGLTLAMCVYIRPDVILMPLLLATVLYRSFFGNVRNIIHNLQLYALGFVTGVFIGGYDDARMYGSWFLSPVQWFRFNVWNKYAGAIYGASPACFYIDKLFEHEPLMFIITIIVSVSLVFTWGKKSKVLSPVRYLLSNGSNYSVYVCVVLLFIYSLNEHKEVRFMHSGIIMMYISLATAIIRIYNFLSRLFSNQNNDQYFIYYVYLFITFFVTSHIYSFMQIRDKELSKWTFGGKTQSSEVNIGLDFLRQRNDVTGVFMDKPLHMTGIYSILHKDVPMLSLNKYEFMEYDKHSRVSEQSGSVKRGHKSVSVFGRISDFISIYNTPYLLKLLIKKTEYNYLVLETDRKFIDIGYHEVFRVGKTKILKRSFLNETEARLAEIGQGIPIGTNATVLEHEGAWLKHYGLYFKAEQRLIISNRLDQTRLGPFQILLDMYKKLGNTDYYTQVLKACTEVHSQKQCLKPYTHLNLHGSYYRNVL